MEIKVRLPKDRIAEGTIEWTGSPRSYPCRGKADNQAAMDHGNPERDPRKPFGDHPAGEYVATEVQKRGPEDATFGPYRIIVQPAGQGDEARAREDAEPGDDGIMAHGGKLQADGVSLRATHGCLRVHNTTIVKLAAAVQAALDAGEKVTYTVETF